MYNKPKSFIVNSLITALIITFSLKEKMLLLTGMPDKLYFVAMFILVSVFLIGIINKFPYLRIAVQFIWSACVAILIATIIGLFIAPFRVQSIPWYIIIIVLTILFQYIQASAYHRYEYWQLSKERDRLNKKHNWRKVDINDIHDMKQEDEEQEDSNESCEPITETPESTDWFAGCTNLESLNKRRRDLLKLYHPDSNNGDDDVSKKINEMYDIERKKYE